MKKIITMLLAISLLTICACSKDESKQPNPETENKTVVSQNTLEDEKPENEKPVVDWKNLYADFLVSSYRYLEDKTTEPFYYIEINDLNFDGVPELFVWDTAASASAGFGIYTIVNNKVEFIWGQSSAETIHNTNYYHSDEHNDPYSNCTDGWIKLCKNSNTGEYKYIFGTGNGSLLESFGSTYSVNYNSEIPKIEREFKEVVFNREEDPTSPPDIYMVKGTNVSKEKYDAEWGAFESEWVDTGYRTPVMVFGSIYEYHDYPNKIKANVSKEGFLNFFELYIPEQIN